MSYEDQIVMSMVRLQAAGHTGIGSDLPQVQESSPYTLKLMQVAAFTIYGDFGLLQVCPAQAITIEAEEREDGSRRTTR